MTHAKSHHGPQYSSKVNLDVVGKRGELDKSPTTCHGIPASADLYGNKAVRQSFSHAGGGRKLRSFGKFGEILLLVRSYGIGLKVSGNALR